jgi:hypothetical protein
MSGSPSFLPTLSKRYSFLCSLSSTLNGISTLEHKAYIEEEIKKIAARIEEEEITDFLDKFS